MSFLSPFFLIGVAALAAPILVHLVRRTRARRVEFPTLLFVRQVPQRSIRRKRLHNLLLLLLRCLALLLVVLAFTRPFFSDGGASASGAAERATIILLDNSLSMRYGERFAQAKSRAGAIIEEGRGEERVALVGFNQGYEVISRFTSETGKLQAELSRMEAGLGGTDYEGALRGAEFLFGELKNVRAKRIFLISDFQATGHDGADSSFRLRDDIRLALIDVGEMPAPNVAVAEVNVRGAVYNQKYTDKLAARVANFSDEARKGVIVDFQINDQTTERREINLEARDTALLEFTGFNLAEGVNRGVITVKDDDFAPDNSFYFTLHRRAPARALVIESAVRGRSESLYLRSALTTGENLPYVLEVKSAGAVDPAGLGNYSIIILNDVGGVKSSLADSLIKFVEAGGGLIIAAGVHAEADGFNQSLGALAPAKLTDKVQLKRGDSVTMSDVKFDHPVFEIFEGGGRLASARVFGYHRSEPREGANVLARFEDGSPALIERAASTKGKVLLFTSTLDTGWSDLPLTPLYLPLVQQVVRYLGEREAESSHTIGQTFTVRRAKPEEPPPAVDTPGGARLLERSLTPDGDLLVRGREQGFYRLRYSEQPDFAAVNLEEKESDFAKLNLDEFAASVTNINGTPVAAENSTQAEGGAAEIEAQQRVWWPLLLVAMLLFIAESLLARRTKMTKMIG
ncbi:MAG TPA: BatA domain-containing protein [Pyrinomonadaceae bacterium]|nr:BatA domain-containing protein [Pyrinomonadaceae bacterium]